MPNIPKDIVTRPFYYTDQNGFIKVVVRALVIIVVKLVNIAVVVVSVAVCT